MADANQTAGKDMEQEATEALAGRNGHDLLFAAMGVITPEEGHISIAEVDEARVGDGYAGVYRARYLEPVPVLRMGAWHRRPSPYCAAVG